MDTRPIYGVWVTLFNSVPSVYMPNLRDQQEEHREISPTCSRMQRYLYRAGHYFGYVPFLC